jgi:hypothetical protein
MQKLLCAFKSIAKENKQLVGVGIGIADERERECESVSSRRGTAKHCQGVSFSSLGGASQGIRQFAKPVSILKILAPVES